MLGLLLVLSQGATGCAVADVHTHHHSSTSTSTHSTHGDRSHAGGTQITRYRDGHRIVTRQGGHTDVTVQRRGTLPGATDTDGRFGYAKPAPKPTDRFARPERLGSAAIDDAARSDPAPASTRDAYRQRMFERLDGAPAASIR